jgi:hypothetical protein
MKTSMNVLPWYKVWVITLLHPRVATGEFILSDVNISPWRAVEWLFISSAIGTFINIIFMLVNKSSQISQNMWVFIGSQILGLFILPAVVLISSTIIHITAKLFRGKGTLKNLVAVSAAFSAPFGILFTISADFQNIFQIPLFALLATILMAYWILIINPIIIRTTYHFRWIGAFLLGTSVYLSFACLLDAFLMLPHIVNMAK